MFCSGCGHRDRAWADILHPVRAALAAPVPPVPPMPGLQFQVENYASKVRSLSIFWFIYAGFSFFTGFAGLTFRACILFEPLRQLGQRSMARRLLGPSSSARMIMGFTWSALAFPAWRDCRVGAVSSAAHGAASWPSSPHSSASSNSPSAPPWASGRWLCCSATATLRFTKSSSVEVSKVRSIKAAYRGKAQSVGHSSHPLSEACRRAKHRSCLLHFDRR